ncbi:50S ribosomal protein L16 3-hydroxylase [Polynucleobacter meluiroseus]|uniref:50S ribosomal protein L16 3-hydroxylase n=1 Tax=Polynucleobacter meluiroseus TaxID=1938814 RepID=A0A240DZQ7_9BURK|nr:cupin domain-containing protein [Polynucleobacter meluiroseus]SNX28669.1 50S ribosomal protein L16 3-hydroxylase [Polynucleobacter meluiroseus]
MTSFYLSKPYDPPHAPKTLVLNEPWPLLGGNSPQQFMKRYWHKKPLLVRGAIPAFSLANQIDEPLSSPISAHELFQFAADEDMEARLIRAKKWSFTEGPFKKKDLPLLESPDWTLLLQGMEAKHPAAATVLSWFRFIPDARLDDLMISIAGLGGGVGPHFDSYDVFLIQMAGRRRWRISAQTDLSLTPNLPLKILQNFKQEQEWILEPGDMLYLPPQIAHDGVALDAGCQTWSVGFRSPSYKELLQEGLWRLAESLEEIPALARRFADPGQEASAHPEQLPAELIWQIEQKLKALRLDRVETFLPGVAAYLSEPKAQAIFTGPENPMTEAEFGKELSIRSLIPHPQSRLLALDSGIFCNGENMTLEQAKATKNAWKALAAKRILKPTQTIRITQESNLYEAYCAGWVIFQE